MVNHENSQALSHLLGSGDIQEPLTILMPAVHHPPWPTPLLEALSSPGGTAAGPALVKCDGCGVGVGDVRVCEQNTQIKPAYRLSVSASLRW